MLTSKLYAPTLREVPSDAEITSHRLMLRAGMIRKAAGGVYTYLPLAWRTIKKIERIIREEMDALRQAFGKRAWGRGEMRVALTPHDSNTTATNPYRISQLRWCWYRAGDSYKASGRIFVAPSFCELLAQTGARATHQDFLAQFLAQIWETQADLYREVMATEVQRCLLNQRMRQCRAMLISLDQLLEVERLTRETAHGQRSLLEAFPQAFR